MPPVSDPRRTFWLAAVAFLPMFLWWLGWFPGFLSADSIDQLDQVASGNFTNGHPAFHTIVLWAITRVWDNPGAISLVQIIALTGVLGLVAVRLTGLGVPRPLAVGAAWLAGWSPAVSITALALWKDVAFTIAFLWVFAELLALVRSGDAFWEDRWSPIRLGGALALVWLFRHNGSLTVLATLGLLAVLNRHRLRRLVPTAMTLAAVVVVATGPLYALFSVDRGKPAAAEVLLPLVASSFVHEPGNFTISDRELLASIAPLEAWNTAYRCDAADGLLFHPEMNIDAIRQDPGPFMQLGIRTVLRDPDTSLGFAWCRASYLLMPAQPADAYLQRPPFRIADNDLGIERAPIWNAAYDVEWEIFTAIGSNGWLWLTWRPALVIWATIATFAALGGRRTRALLLPGALIGFHLINVAATSLNHEFRLALPLYAAGLLSLPLWYFVRYPDRLVEPAVVPVTPGRTLPDHDVASVGLGQREVERTE